MDGIFKSTKGQGVSKQSLDTQSSQLQVAKNELFSAQKSLELAKIGPRAEDVARAYAQWQQTKSASCPIRSEVKAEYVVCAPRHNGSFEAPSAGGHG